MVLYYYQIFQTKGLFEVLESWVAVSSLPLPCVNCFPFDLSLWEHPWSGIGTFEFSPSSSRLPVFSPGNLTHHISALKQSSPGQREVLPAGLSTTAWMGRRGDTVQSMGRDVGGVMLSRASSKAACLKQDWAVLARMAQGRLQGTVILGLTVALTPNNFGIVWDHIHL